MHPVTPLGELVVGLDGSAASAAALRWSVKAVGRQGRVHAVAVADDGLDVRELRDTWVPSALADTTTDENGTVDTVVLEGDAPDELLRCARDVGADAVVVGHHARPRFGPRVVGHVTATLLHDADRPIIVVPTDWRPTDTVGRPVAVGVGVSAGTEAAVRWAIAQPAAHEDGLLLAHAYGPRTIFRPDGWLDVLAYHLDPTVLPEWVEQDLLDLADRVGAETGVDVDVDVAVRPGRAGA
ncbi:MAG: universal stress protein, partial [Acidimicrobiia bacterium]